MRDLDKLFAALRRARFRLGAKECAYLEERGLAIVCDHAAEFVARRLAAVQPVNDGRQTPMRGHPVFIAQHATATCCRSFLAKWHDIAAGHALDDQERHHVAAAITCWLTDSLS